MKVNVEASLASMRSFLASRILETQGFETLTARQTRQAHDKISHLLNDLTTATGRDEFEVKCQSRAVLMSISCSHADPQVRETAALCIQALCE